MKKSINNLIDKYKKQEDICQGYFLQKIKAKNRINTATLANLMFTFSQETSNKVK